jgi:hypothetical protein
MASKHHTKEQLQEILARSEYRLLPTGKERALKLVLEEKCSTREACKAVSDMETVSRKSLDRAKKAISQGRTPFAQQRPAYLSPEQETELVQFVIERGKSPDPFHESEVLSKVGHPASLLTGGGFLLLSRSGSGPLPPTHPSPSPSSTPVPGRANSTRRRSEGGQSAPQCVRHAFARVVVRLPRQEQRDPQVHNSQSR